LYFDLAFLCYGIAYINPETLICGVTIKPQINLTKIGGATPQAGFTVGRMSETMLV
jgi:hypothetical protein